MCTLDTYFNDQHTVMSFPGLLKCLIIPKSLDRLLQAWAFSLSKDIHFAHFSLSLLPVMKENKSHPYTSSLDNKFDSKIEILQWCNI